LEYVPVDERQALANLRGELGLSRNSEAIRNLWAENAAILLRHFPLWAVTALSVPSRIPLQPAMFDHVVIDEATTCDIAAALPLLARARHATIVGDPMQTGLVGDIAAGRERAILEKEGLWLGGIGRFAFSQTSLFHLAQSTDAARRHMLRDHFRCQGEIADFISELFYGRRLAVLTDEAKLRPPPGTKPGLHWTPVTGPLQSAGQGCTSDAEASAIADHLHKLLEIENYQGTVGVVTPFKRQAELVRRYAEQRLAHTTIERADLRVATGHAFQGDARDVILISPCYAQDMPQGARWFLRQGASLFNVAVSRARAVCHVFGDLDACERSDIRHLALLARRIKSPPVRAGSGEQKPFESPWEERLYDALRARGIQTVPQYRIAGRRLDLAFVDGERKFDIEVDGDAYHRDPDGFRKVSDIWRDHQLQGLGWRVIRFWVYELKKDMEACVERVATEIGR
jgi:very-short-patch-repair endonuclease